MKTRSIMGLAIATFIVCFSACKKEQSCDLHAADNSVADMEITFRAIGEGDGSISSLTYLVGTESTTVYDISLPWTATAMVSDGEYVSISAKGEVKKGTLKIQFDGATADSSAYMIQSDYCSENY